MDKILNENDYYDNWAELIVFSQDPNDVDILIDELKILGLDIDRCIKFMIWAAEVGIYNHSLNGNQGYIGYTKAYRYIKKYKSKSQLIQLIKDLHYITQIPEHPLRLSIIKNYIKWILY